MMKFFRFLIFTLALLQFKLALAVHYGQKFNQEISPVGALVKLERSDLKSDTVKELGVYPSLVVTCSLTRIRHNIAITNTHCIIPYLNETGQWSLSDDLELFVSFNQKLNRFTESNSFLLHKVKKIIHQYNTEDLEEKETWDQITHHPQASMWEDILNFVIPRDMAIIQFEVNDNEEDFLIASIKSSEESSQNLEITMIGYGPTDFLMIDKTGERNYGIGSLQKSDEVLTNSQELSWFLSPNYKGGLPADSGGFIGKVTSDGYELHGLTVCSPYTKRQLGDTLTYYSPLKRLHQTDLKWIEDSISELDRLKESDEVQVLFKDLY